MSFAEEQIKIVRELNEEMESREEYKYFRFTYETEGKYGRIKFLEYVVWDEIDDEREWDIKKHKYEDLKQYIKKSLREYGKILSSIK